MLEKFARYPLTFGPTPIRMRRVLRSRHIWTGAAAAGKTVKAKGFVLSMDVMQTLGELGVSLPTSEENVRNTVEELKGKLSYFKENQERVTKEVRACPMIMSLSWISPFHICLVLYTLPVLRSCSLVLLLCFLDFMFSRRDPPTSLTTFHSRAFFSCNR